MRRVAFLALALLGLASVGFAGDEMILVYPGKPGSHEAAKPTLQRFSEYLEQRAGWQKGSLHLDYFNDEAEAMKVVNGDNKPAYAIVSLALYLKWKKEGIAITVLAQSELDKKPTMQFHLLVPAGSRIEKFEDLKGGTVASCYLEDRKFASRVIFDGKLDMEHEVAVVDTKSISLALGACANFKQLKNGKRIDAVLLDDDQMEGFKEAKDFKKLHVAWSSKELPTPPVVTFSNTNAGKAQALLQILTSMSGSDQGREILKDLTSTGFRSPNMGAYAEVEKAY